MFISLFHGSFLCPDSENGSVRAITQDPLRSLWTFSPFQALHSHGLATVSVLGRHFHILFLLSSFFLSPNSLLSVLLEFRHDGFPLTPLLNVFSSVGIVCVVDAFGLRKRKIKKLLSVKGLRTRAASQYADYNPVFLHWISYWQIQLNSSCKSVE